MTRVSCDKCGTDITDAQQYHLMIESAQSKVITADLCESCRNRAAQWLSAKVTPS